MASTTDTGARPLTPDVRARLWLPADVFRSNPQDNAPRLWLVQADGRVLALRLPEVTLGDDTVLAPLVGALAHDLRGMLWEVEHPAFGWAQILYAAPVLPVLRSEHAAFLFEPDFARFAASLDAEIIRLLYAMERKRTAPAISRPDDEALFTSEWPFFASVRNYNRLITLSPVQRVRRLQAIERFAALVAPILLTVHRAPNVWDGKRHAWRDKDTAVEAAIDAGRDLTGALARHYGISRGLVRAPLNRIYWHAPTTATRTRWLKLLDALPANQRPTLQEFERWQPYLANYFALLGENHLGQSQLTQAHRGAFRLGWTRTWETAARRYDGLHRALADCRDFLTAAREHSAQRLRHPLGPAPSRLASAWLACHGLLGLLAASDRWHRLRPATRGWYVPEGFCLPEILGRFEDKGRQALELLTPNALAVEGEALHHCVANYWPDCVAGDRIFALQLADGERATAQYHPFPNKDVEHDVSYELVQLRGPSNDAVSLHMQVWAEIVGIELNQPSRQAARLAALQVRERLAEQGRHMRWQHLRLDDRSERQLQQALAWLRLTPLSPEVVLAGQVAGFQYHSGPQLIDRFMPGQPLALVREPDNPHDRLAVRLDWHGEKIGYVPRTHNAEIAHRLDAGETLTARILDIDPEAEPWHQVTFVIEAAGPAATDVPRCPDRVEAADCPARHAG